MSGLTRQELRSMLLIAGVTALVVAIYWPSYERMAELWTQSSYRHGSLIFPISAFLIWRKRESVARAAIVPWAPGIALLAGLVLVWLVAGFLRIQVAEQAAAVALVPVSIVTFLGLDLARRILFPILFLLAAIPFGDALIPYLMVATADVSVGLLNLVGTPVLRQGQFISLPGGEFEVADVCSGLRYLTAGSILALLFSYLTFHRIRNRVIFVVAIALTLILANGVRAFAVMYIASATDLEYFAGRDHVYFGWLLFAVVLVAGFWLGARIADSIDRPVRRARAGAAEPVPERVSLTPLAVALGLALLAVTARPLEKDFGSAWIVLLLVAAALVVFAFRGSAGGDSANGDAESPARGAAGRYGKVLTAVVSVGIIASGPALSGWASASAVKGAVALELPGIAGCSGPVDWSRSWYPEMHGPDGEVAGSYRCRGDEINVFTAMYTGNEQGSELISSANTLIPHDWRRYTVRRPGRFVAADGDDEHVVEVEVAHPYGGVLIWYWYEVDGNVAVNSIYVKLRQAWQFVTSGKVDGRVMLLEIPITATVEDSREQLAAVARELGAAGVTGAGKVAQQQ